MPTTARPPRLAAGSPAPDSLLLDADGQPASLSARWVAGPTVLTFLRHFG